jgi:2'-5' RNA ligase
MTSMAESARPWRCFWAVPLPSELRAALSSFVARLRAVPGVGDDWRFTETDGWHVTLAFLGGMPPETVEPMVAQVAAAVDGIEPFELHAGGLGAFGGRRQARVLWYGLTDDDRRLRDLARGVRAAAGLDVHDPFRAHVTLARSRDRYGAALPAPHDEPPTGLVPVKEVVLLRSHLGRGPARYEAIARIPLRVAAASVAGS